MIFILEIQMSFENCIPNQLDFHPYIQYYHQTHSHPKLDYENRFTFEMK